MSQEKQGTQDNFSKNSKNTNNSTTNKGFKMFFNKILMSSTKWIKSIMEILLIIILLVFIVIFVRKIFNFDVLNPSFVRHFLIMGIIYNILLIIDYTIKTVFSLFFRSNGIIILSDKFPKFIYNYLLALEEHYEIDSNSYKYYLFSLYFYIIMLIITIILLCIVNFIYFN